MCNITYTGKRRAMLVIKEKPSYHINLKSNDATEFTPKASMMSPGLRGFQRTIDFMGNNLGSRQRRKS